MKIELHEIAIREVVDQYTDLAEEGVTGYGGQIGHPPQISAGVCL